LAGGIGVTPLLSMLKCLAHSRNDVAIYFIHAARNSRVHAMAGEVREIAARHGNVNAHFRYDSPLHDDLTRGRCDSTGLVDMELVRQIVPTSDADFYMCGPKSFMAGLYRGLRDWDVEEQRIHFEFFGPRQEIVSSPDVAWQAMALNTV
jgi:nitric oxide dioxygenase